MRLITSLVVISLLALSACDRPEEPAPAPPAPNVPAPRDAPEEPEEETVTDEEMSAMDRAVAADRALRQRLLGRVMEVVQEDGLAAGVTVCREEAIPLTEAVAEEHQVRMGRFSERLRNPDNRAPEWALSLIEEAGDEAGSEALVATDDTLRRVSPLHIAAPCLSCHGEKSGLPEEVQSALDRLYPDDQATGYEEGDLRGWVWVEVP